MRKKDFQKAIKFLKQSKEFPENLGRGKPYDPDYTVQDQLIAICQEAESKKQEDFQITLEVKELIEKINNKYK
jgi:hypothetical protein